MVIERNGQGGTAGGGPNRSELNSGGANMKHKSAPRMVPFLGKKSVIALIIGLAIGVGLGLGYWALSPKISELISNISLSSTNTEYDGPHESTVDIQIVNPGSSYMSIKDLQYLGEYYAATSNSYPFFEFLSQELSEQAPEYSKTTKQLQESIQIRYDWDSDLPTIEVKVTGDSDEEALYLAGFTPLAFQSFLIEEEIKEQEEEHQRILAEIDTIKAALLIAEEELSVLELERASYLLSNDPDYITLNAQIAALETQLDVKSHELATFISAGDSGEDYMITLAAVDRIVRALGEAKSQLTILEAQSNAGRLPEDLEYLTTKITVDQLNWELTTLNERLASYIGGTTEDEVVNYLAIGNPSTPLPVVPDRIRGRNAAMIGGICGIGVAWVAINRKWIINQLSSPATGSTDEGMEDEA